MTKKKSRAEIIELINKFLAVTVDRGAGEAEAIFAASKAAKLMAEYDLSYDDLASEQQDKSLSDTYHEFNPDLTRFVYMIAKAVGALCNVDVFQTGVLSGKVHIIGPKMGVIFAEYIFNICVRAMKTEVERNKSTWYLFEHRRQRRMKESFLAGMADRLKQRLNEISWIRRQESGSALVVYSRKDIADYLDSMGLVTGAAKLRGRMVDPVHYRAGESAANRISLNNAIHGTDDPSFEELGGQQY